MSKTKLNMDQQMDSLMQALSVGKPTDEPLQVEPLPKSFFAGQVHSIVEHATGNKLEILSSYYDKDLNGVVVTVQDASGELRDLNPDQFDIWEVLSYNSDTDQLTPVNVFSQKRIE